MLSFITVKIFASAVNKKNWQRKSDQFSKTKSPWKKKQEHQRKSWFYLVVFLFLFLLHQLLTWCIILKLCESTDLGSKQTFLQKWKSNHENQILHYKQSPWKDVEKCDFKFQNHMKKHSQYSEPWLSGLTSHSHLFFSLRDQNIHTKNLF